MAGVKLAVVTPVDGGPQLICVDRIGADVGQTVLVANGSRVRDIVLDNGTPVKTVLLGIVDEVSA